MMRRGPEFEIERRVAAERTLELTRECLTSLSIRRKMGRLASEIEEVSHLARIPDIADGFVMDIEAYDDQDVFPFVVARVNEKLASTMLGASSPMQSVEIEAMALQLGLDGDDEGSAEQDGPREAREYYLSPYEEGVTWGSYTDLSTNKYGSLYCAERPFVLVRMKRSVKQAVVATVHELTHAHDLLSKPIFHGRTGREINLEVELRAYTLDNAVSDLLFGKSGGQRTQQISKFVAKLRQHVNGSVRGDVAFRPDEQISEAIRIVGLEKYFDSL